MVEQITMNVDDTLELDYLVEQINDNTIDVTKPNGASFSVDYLKRHSGVFDPSDPGSYTLDIDGQTIEVQVTDIPETDMFQSPIYHFYAGEISESDGTSPVEFPEVSAGLSSAVAVGSPTYRESDLSYPAIEYDPDDGDNDGHNWTSDSQIPTGDNPFGIFGLVQVPNTKFQIFFDYGDGSSDDNGIEFRVASDGSVEGGHYNTIASSSGTLTAGELSTIGLSYDGENIKVGLNGNFDNTLTRSTNATIKDQDHYIGYRSGTGSYWDGYISEIVVCDAGETDQAFSDYHNNRLG